ncbi:MAG: GspH/FimT family pseudopilin [Motiliproteus sp.]
MSRKLVRRHLSVPFLFYRGRYPLLMHYSAGLTLTELVVSLSIMATLSTAGASSFQHLISNSRVDALAMSLRTDLMFVRSEAINRGQRVLLCRQGAAPDSCAGSSSSGQLSWQQGWLVFVDANNDSQLSLSNGDQILRVQQPLNSQLQVKWNRGDFIGYQGSGALSSLNGTFCVGDWSGDSSLHRELVLPHSGRLRTARVECRYSFP